MVSHTAESQSKVGLKVRDQKRGLESREMGALMQAHSRGEAVAVVICSQSRALNNER